MKETLDDSRNRRLRGASKREGGSPDPQQLHAAVEPSQSRGAAMKAFAHGLGEQARRERQQEIGLVFQPAVLTIQQEKRDDVMQENTTPASKPNRAEQVLRHLSAAPTFKEVAIHEAKRAAIWAPILVTTLFSAAWLNKRFILKAATGI